MKSIVLTCKNITEDTEAYETSSEQLTDDDLDRLGDVKNKLSVALTNLMGTAKYHAQNFGSSPISDLESAASSLTAIIVELVELLQISSGGNMMGQSNSSKQREIYDIEHLKVRPTP